MFVIIEVGVVESYPTWFEDFPFGCGNCGSEEHANASNHVVQPNEDVVHAGESSVEEGQST